jgi:hypothetical protein
MSDKLSAFLESCYRDPAARCRLSEFARAYRASLPLDEATKWSRTRLVSELSKTFSIGADHRGVTWIAGVALSPPAGWRVEDGQLVRA